MKIINYLKVSASGFRSASTADSYGAFIGLQQDIVKSPKSASNYLRFYSIFYFRDYREEGRGSWLGRTSEVPCLSVWGVVYVIFFP